MKLKKILNNSIFFYFFRLKTFFSVCIFIESYSFEILSLLIYVDLKNLNTCIIFSCMTVSWTSCFPIDDISIIFSLLLL